MLVDLPMSLHVKNKAHMIRFCTLGCKIKLTSESFIYTWDIKQCKVKEIFSLSIDC